MTIAWGRDYSDVPPVKGVALGGGKQVISVSVEVLPEASSIASTMNQVVTNQNYR